VTLSARIRDLVGVVDPLHQRAAEDPPEALEGSTAPLELGLLRPKCPLLLFLRCLGSPPLCLVATALLVESVEGLALLSLRERDRCLELSPPSMPTPSVLFVPGAQRRTFLGMTSLLGLVRGANRQQLRRALVLLEAGEQ
jgi:hypothetical protein